LGELRANVDAAQMAFELHTMMWGANAMLQLDNNKEMGERVKKAIRDRLRGQSLI